MTEAPPDAATVNGVSSRRLLRGVPAALYAVAIFYGGVINVGPLPTPEGVPSDKLLHFVVFGGFEWVLELALVDSTPGKRRVLAILLAVLVGILLELVQATLPTRSAEALDILADSLGALSAALLLFALARVRRLASAR